MNHADYVALIRPGVGAPGGVWADVGAGAGTFALALRDVAGPDVQLHLVDRDASALRQGMARFERQFPGSRVTSIVADFTRPFQVPPLDGVLVANALHFVPSDRQVSLLTQLRPCLKPGGRLILVEYNTDTGNRWAPHPLSFGTFQRRAQKAGFQPPRLVGRVPSSWLGEMYAAVAFASPP